jgi:tetratricopeptide (TPR) repeat protein
MHSIQIKIFSLCIGICFYLLFFTVPYVPAQEGLGKARITGTVLDEQGNPIEGVSIVLENVYNTKLDGSSDKRGHFAISGMGTGVWTLTATKDGYAPSSQQINVRQLRRNPPIEIIMKKLTGTAAFFSNEETMDMFNQADKLMEEEKYTEALDIYLVILEKHPDFYQTHLNIGHCYLKQGDLEKAEAEFTLVLEKIKELHGDLQMDKTTALGALSSLGTLYLQKEDFQKAQEYFTQSLDLSPEDPAAAYNVGEIFFSNQRLDEAIKYFELASQIDKSWPAPYLKLGYVYLNKAEYDKSIENFNKFIQLDPDNPEMPNVKKMIEAIEKLKK